MNKLYQSTLKIVLKTNSKVIQMIIPVSGISGSSVILLLVIVTSFYLLHLELSENSKPFKFIPFFNTSIFFQDQENTLGLIQLA